MISKNPLQLKWILILTVIFYGLYFTIGGDLWGTLGLLFSLILIALTLIRVVKKIRINEQTKKYFSEVLQFLKKSYPPLLRNLLIISIGVVLVWGYVVAYNLKSTADDKISALKNQINQEYESELQKYEKQAASPECQAIIKQYEEKQKTERFAVPTADYYFCTTPPSGFNQNSYVLNSQIKELNAIKENSLLALFFQKILPFLFFIACVAVDIPIIRILWMLAKRLYRGSGQIKEELIKMPSFQKYTVILLVVILMVLILMMIF